MGKFFNRSTSNKTKPRRRKRKIFFAIIAALVVVLLVFHVVDLIRNPRNPDKQHLAQWQQPGNIIISYGSTLDPHPTGTRNVYSVHTPDGTLIDRITGDGIERQFTVPTRGGTYLYFPTQVRQIGSQHSTDPQSIGYPSGHTDYSPSGNFGVALSHTWSGTDCGYKASILKADGSITATELNLEPRTPAVSEDYALIIGECQDKQKLLAVDPNGNAEELPLPADFSIAPVTPLSYINYLGNNRFDLVTTEESEDDSGNTTIDSVSYEIEYGTKRKDSGTPINISAFSHTIPADAEAHNWTSDGGYGYILASGDVYVLHRLSSKAKHTGNIGHIGEISKAGQYGDNELMSVNSPTTEPLFGLRQGDTITIRKWSQPEQVMSTLPISEHAKACDPNLCRVTGIDVIP